MKSQHKVILFSLLLGLLAGLIDALVGYFFFSKGSFLDLLIFDVPSQEIYVRTFLLLACLVFGLVISRQLERQNELQEIITTAKKEWEETFDIIHDAVTIHDRDFNVVRMNRAAARLLRMPFQKALSQKCYQSYHGSDSPHENCPGRSVFQTGVPHSHVIFEPTLNRHLEIKAIPRFNKKNEVAGIVHVVSDVTQRIQAEEQLKAVSLTDELTGLLNRRGFVTMAEQQIKLAHRLSQKKYLLYADLDNLKIINDRLGHHEGDMAIIAIANVLKQNFRESDIVGRIGGDEFVALPYGSDRNEIDVMLERLQKMLDIANETRESGFELSMSIGVAAYDPNSPCSVEDLMSEADARMYEQKKLKKRKSG